MRTVTLCSLLVGALLQAACAQRSLDYRSRGTDPEPLHEAVRDLSEVMTHDIFSPPQASRAYAYASIAAYEALRQDRPEYHTLAGQLNGLDAVPAPAPGAELYLPLAAVHAFMTVGKALTFSQARMDSLRAELDERYRRMGIPAPVFDRSVAYGEAVGNHVLAWSRKDHYAETRNYPRYAVTSDPGRWSPTPPAYMDAVEPHWGELRPFALDSASQFRPARPPAYDTARASAYWREVKEVYDTRIHLTDEQRAIASFWDCNPYVMNVQGHAMFATKKLSPGGHWMGIAGTAARKSRADMMRSAEAYARTAIALADGFISAWNEKFNSNMIRPETVINASLDEGWQPLLQTPPFPEYPSAHSVISSAAALVLSDEFGAHFAFADSTEAEFGLPVRSFASFQDAAKEAAISRLYGGIHYRSAIEQGLVEGHAVGALMLRRVQTRTSSTLTERTAAR
jgi:hypothetical protein